MSEIESASTAEMRPGAAVLLTDRDPWLCEWLTRLVAAGELPPAHILCADIADIDPADLDGHRQAHFFCGIGGWPLAAQWAQWPDTLGLWTASLPCQPFSQAGLGKGAADERHLWPQFRQLVAIRRPPVVAGEQVASRLGRDWLAAVRDDLESLGYAVGAADLPAAGCGAPHIRQRLFWGARLADAGGSRRGAGSPSTDLVRAGPEAAFGGRGDGRAARAGAAVADADRGGQGPQPPPRQGAHGSGSGGDGAAVARPGPEPRSPGLPVAHPGRVEGRHRNPSHDHRTPFRAQHPRGPAATEDRSRGLGGRGPWAGTELIDAGFAAFPVEPGTPPLVDGLPADVGRARARMVAGYGNAIVPQLGAVFLRALLG